ncbi:linear amide C-N hydrolase [candidate division KSB1 bacterium]|nr:linear amide C-N hydrolase [candidate division KSB1 bacterium]
MLKSIFAGKKTSVFFYLLLVTVIVNCRSDPGSSEAGKGLNQKRTLATLKKFNDVPFYTMTYFGDYGFKEYLKTGDRPSFSSNNNNSSRIPQWTCTCFAAMPDSGDKIFGRNFDWKNKGALLLCTHPPDAYASVAMVDIGYLDHSKYLTEGDSSIFLEAPYWPFDGMNENGVCIGLMAVSQADPPADADKNTIFTLDVIRLILDYAKNVEHAVSLLQQYNVSMTGGPPCHYLVADVFGKSAIIEFVDGEMKIINNSEPWQVSTNFIVTGSAAPQQTPCWRYDLIYKTLQDAAGRISTGNALKNLENVSQDHTMWSVVYDMSARSLLVSLDRDYENIFEFTFENGSLILGGNSE